jgi:Ser/Thr protein kinase RdoA (MazF antagonist)
MKIRFQADADLNQIIVLATLRREPAIDFQTAAAAGLAARDDQEVLNMSARDGRLLVTHDQNTMPRHFRGVHQNQSKPGLAGYTPASPLLP